MSSLDPSTKSAPTAVLAEDEALLADELADYLNTGVKINLSRKKGQIHIDFGSVADLRRIIDEIKRH